MRMRDVSRGRSASRSRAGLALGIAAASVLLGGRAVPAAAQTGFIPYYGKNNIHYDTFEWQVYQTDHFEIYYYPELEKHLERIAGYAESAYQKVSADLHHDLSAKVPMILFKTHSEFEQQNVIPGAAQEGVGAFVESNRGRMLLPIDDPPDRLYGLITHELTHSFENDIIPPGLIRRGVPLWVMEGLSDYERGDWVPADLMMVRDAAVSDIVPAMIARRVRARGKPEARLQPRARGLRVHRGAVRQRGTAPVPVRAPQERHWRRRGRVRGSVQDDARRNSIRPSSAISRSGSSPSGIASGRSTTAAIWRRTPKSRPTSRRWRLRRRRPAI